VGQPHVSIELSRIEVVLKYRAKFFRLLRHLSIIHRARRLLGFATVGFRFLVPNLTEGLEGTVRG
jgi:hypothetical protein